MESDVLYNCIAIINRNRYLQVKNKLNILKVANFLTMTQDLIIISNIVIIVAAYQLF